MLHLPPSTPPCRLAVVVASFFMVLANRGRFNRDAYMLWWMGEAEIDDGWQQVLSSSDGGCRR